MAVLLEVPLGSYQRLKNENGLFKYFLKYMQM